MVVKPVVLLAITVMAELPEGDGFQEAYTHAPAAVAQWATAPKGEWRLLHLLKEGRAQVDTAPTGALEAEADPTLVAVVVAATQVEPAEISQNLAAGMKMVAAVEVRTTPEQINRMLLVRIRVMVRFNCS